jgi:diguanylate cyclase (GGDEF)-like protein
MRTTGTGRPRGAGASFDASDRTGLDAASIEVGSLDPSTGVWSASVWNAVVGHEAARLTRYRRPVSVVAVAIEHLDRLAEALGAHVADNYVRAVASILRQLTTPPDLVARSADGPFLVLLAEANEPARLDFARRLRAECDPWLEGAQPGTRLSIAGASLDAEQSFDVAVRVALDAVLARPRRAQQG